MGWSRYSTAGIFTGIRESSRDCGEARCISEQGLVASDDIFDQVERFNGVRQYTCLPTGFQALDVTYTFDAYLFKTTVQHGTIQCRRNEALATGLWFSWLARQKKGSLKKGGRRAKRDGRRLLTYTTGKVITLRNHPIRSAIKRFWNIKSNSARAPLRNFYFLQDIKGTAIMGKSRSLWMASGVGRKPQVHR